VYWSPYDGLLEFRVGTSRELGACVVLGHLLSAVAVIAAGLHALLLIPVLGSLVLALRTALAPLGRQVHAISWSPARGWERVMVSSSRESMELRGSSVVTNRAMFLHWDVGQATWHIVVPKDAMHTDDWRRMRVIVGLCEGRDRMPAAAHFAALAGRTSSTAPGLTEWRMDSPGFRGACPDGHEKQRPVAGREGPAR
jgi:hypothetical protein